MKMHYNFLILFFIILFAACQKFIREPLFTKMTHASLQIHVNGETRNQILKRWGDPQEKLKKDFKVTGYPYTIMLDLKGKEMISFYGHTGDPARVTYLKKIREVVKDSKVFMLKEDSNEKDKAPKKKPEEDSADEF